MALETLLRISEMMKPFKFIILLLIIMTSLLEAPNGQMNNFKKQWNLKMMPIKSQVNVVVIFGSKDLKLNRLSFVREAQKLMVNLFMKNVDFAAGKNGNSNR